MLATRRSQMSEGSPDVFVVSEISAERSCDV